MLTPDLEEKLGLDTDVVKDDDRECENVGARQGEAAVGNAREKEEKVCKRP